MMATPARLVSGEGVQQDQDRWLLTARTRTHRHTVFIEAAADVPGTFRQCEQPPFHSWCAGQAVEILYKKDWCCWSLPLAFRDTSSACRSSSVSNSILFSISLESLLNQPRHLTHVNTASPRRLPSRRPAAPSNPRPQPIAPGSPRPATFCHLDLSLDALAHPSNLTRGVIRRRP
jgi:hypothetical protein